MGTTPEPIVQSKIPVEFDGTAPDACPECQTCLGMGMPGCLGHYPPVKPTE